MRGYVSVGAYTKLDVVLYNCLVVAFINSDFRFVLLTP